MKRRRFLGLTAAAFSAAFSRQTCTADDNTAKTYDRFGGWTGKKFSATNFFRVEQDDDRWWLVTPDGNAFLSFGINHLHSDLWKQSYNEEAWKQQLGLSSLNSRGFQPALREWFGEICRQYGFNTVGVHTSLPVVNTPQPFMPYMRPIPFVDIPHWKVEIPDENFVDVFSQEYALHCDRFAKEAAAPLRDDPFLLGYAMTDCPLFTEEDCRERTDVIGGARRESRIGWPRRLRNFGGDAPGKQAWVKTMRELYRDSISDFNATYETNFDSFSTLANARNWRPHTDLSNGYETRDNIEFLKRVVAQYYKTAKDAIRRYDPNHMFFGDKLNANTDSIDTVLSVTSHFTDVVFYQMYGRYEVQQPGLDRWSNKVAMPFINGDSAFTMVTDNMPRPYGPVADNLQQRIDWTREFFVSAFKRPDFVGWHYCGLIDAPNQIARKAARQHSGLMNGFGEPYAGLREIIKESADNMYGIATGEV